MRTKRLARTKLRLQGFISFARYSERRGGRVKIMGIPNTGQPFIYERLEGDISVKMTTVPDRTDNVLIQREHHSFREDATRFIGRTVGHFEAVGFEYLDKPETVLEKFNRDEKEAFIGLMKVMSVTTLGLAALAGIASGYVAAGVLLIGGVLMFNKIKYDFSDTKGKAIIAAGKIQEALGRDETISIICSKDLVGVINIYLDNPDILAEHARLVY